MAQSSYNFVFFFSNPQVVVDYCKHVLSSTFSAIHENPTGDIRGASAGATPMVQLRGPQAKRELSHFLSNQGVNFRVRSKGIGLFIKGLITSRQKASKSRVTDH